MGRKALIDATAAAAAVHAAGGNISEAARRMGHPQSSLWGAYRRHLDGLSAGAKIAGEGFQFAKPPSELPTAEELLERRSRDFGRRDAAERAGKLIPVAITLDGPIGITHFGDPHVDDDGCDIDQLREHVQIVRETPGMYAANVGDYHNNWTGRLAHLHGQQGVRAAEAWVLVEWLIKSLPWLYLVGGNHDAWAGDGDPIRWMAAQAGLIYKPDAVRMALTFGNGRQVRVNARHTFRGQSQWNAAHGQTKAAVMGWRDHILVAGHTHTSGYNIVKDPASGTISHCIQVGTYKVHDAYARQCNFPDGNFAPAAVTIIDPDAADERELISTFWSVRRGAEYLTFLRDRRGAAASRGRAATPRTRPSPGRSR